MDIDQQSQQPSGVRCLFEVLRHLLRHIPQDVRSTTIQEGAKKNPLLQMILSNSIDGLRTAVQDMHTGTEDVPFDTLIESDLMINTFWSIPDLVLWKDLDEVRFNEDGTKDLIPCVAPPGLTARKSLTVWPIGDNPTPLQKCIQRQVALVRDTTTGIRYWQDLNLPFIMRVRWNSDPKVDMENPYKLTDLALLQLKPAFEQEKTPFHLIAIVRLRGDEADTDSFATFSMNRERIEHEDKAIADPDSIFTTSYMLYYASGPPLGDATERRCNEMPPLLLIKPATKKQIALTDRLLEQSMKAVKLAENAAQDRLRSQHGSSASPPRTESPSRVPKQQGHASPREVFESQPITRNEAPSFNIQTPQPMTREPSSVPPSPYVSSPGSFTQFVPDQHVLPLLESPTKQQASSSRESRASSSVIGVKRSIEQDHNTWGKKRQRCDNQSDINSPVGINSNARPSPFERDRHASGNVQ